MQDLSLIAPPPGGVIGYCGHAGSGKSHMAQTVLRTCGYPAAVMSFASPLKTMTHSLLTIMGVGHSSVERMVHGDMKEVEIDPNLFPGLTTRKLMQTLGTEWGRNTVDPDLWTKIMLARLAQARVDGYAVIIDDVRFQNEVKLIHSLGGKVVRIHRTGLTGPLADAHVSETLPLYDTTYMNMAPACGN